MCDALETSAMNKEAILRNNPELSLPDLDGVLSVDVIRGPDKVYFMLAMPSKKPGMFDVKVKYMKPQKRIELSMVH